MNKEFNKGLLLASLDLFGGGFLVLFILNILLYIGHIELVVHRCLWTALL